MTDLQALLAPLGAVDHRVGPLAGDFTPIGVVLHHTASGITQNPVPSLKVVRDGRSDLPGPLCNVLIGRDGSINTITDGRANDTGGGDLCVLAALKAGRDLPAPDDRDGHRTNGNPWFYDIEVENDGVGESYSDRVLEATARVAAAICTANGWGVERVLRHRDWTRRKIDWSWQGDHHALVARYMGDDDMPLSQEDFKLIRGIAHEEALNALDERNLALNLEATLTLVRELKAKLDAQPADAAGADVTAEDVADELAERLRD